MTTQVDFYVLDQATAESRWQFCSRLLPKVIGRQQRCSVLVNSEAEAEQLDSWLWQQPPESFLPHAIKTSGSEANHPIEIVSSPTASAAAVCINLRPEVPSNHADIPRLVEVVCQLPDVLNSTREKYRFYRQLGYPLQSHPVKTLSH